MLVGFLLILKGIAGERLGMRAAPLSSITLHATLKVWSILGLALELLFDTTVGRSKDLISGQGVWLLSTGFGTA